MKQSRCDECGQVLEADGTCTHLAEHGDGDQLVIERDAQDARKRLARHVAEVGNLPKHLSQLYELLKSKGLDLADLEAANIERLKFYQSMHKDGNDEAVITDLAGITLSPGWESGPQWPVVQPARPFKFPAVKSITVRHNGKVAVVLPDMQIGYFHIGDPRNPQLEPIHDERAMAIAMSIIRTVRPDLVVFLGDNLDLAEWGSYRQYPQFANTTQVAIYRAAAMLAEIRSIVPDAKFVWLEGNHERRMDNTVVDNAKAAYGLRKAGSTFRDAPVLSVPNLLNFDEYGVEYVSGYPGGEYRITKWLTAIHGKKARADGATMPSYLRQGWDSVLAGHIHRIERYEQTRMSYKGPRTKVAASPGCLCRIDGVVPSTNGGMDIYGRPVPLAENWQQGLMVVDYEDEGWFNLDQVTIWSGRTVWRGKEYLSELPIDYLHPSVASEGSM